MKLLESIVAGVFALALIALLATLSAAPYIVAGLFFWWLLK